MDNCSVCKSTSLSRLEDEVLLSYKNTDIPITIKYSTCDSCHREFISTSQILENDAVARNAKKSHDGLMTAVEIKSAREKIGITQEEASLIFGGGRNAFSKYERSEVSQSLSMDNLIKICLKYPGILKELASQKGVSIKDMSLVSEDNVIPYETFKAANQAKYESHPIDSPEEIIYG